LKKQLRGKKIAAYVVGHLPIVKAYAIKIGLVDIINQLVPSKMAVEPGTLMKKREPFDPAYLNIE